ncbi:hypothetical protein V5T82_12430 [Magnetovibrio sp. PR-2]|uniref:hypothetical protein n=1 Tax=Magnetovibrio sp. PR-2 TaxID=3120356 RepID=UPI002FCE030A
MSAQFFQTYILEDLIEKILHGDYHHAVELWRVRVEAVGKCERVCGDDRFTQDTLACGRCLARKLYLEGARTANDNAGHAKTAGTLEDWLQTLIAPQVNPSPL